MSTQLLHKVERKKKTIALYLYQHPTHLKTPLRRRWKIKSLLKMKLSRLLLLKRLCKGSKS